MATELPYPPGIPYRSPRPRAENGVAGTTDGWLLELLSPANPTAPVAAESLGDLRPNRPPSLAVAIRSYLRKKGLTTIAFYRYGPRRARVLFGHKGQYWFIASHAPADPNWTIEKLDDWLYGDLVQALELQLAEID